MDEFDRAFKACFPEMKYARYYDEILLSFDKKKYDVKYFDDLFSEHELKMSDIWLVTPGDSPVPFSGGFLFIHQDGIITLVEEETFFSLQTKISLVLN